MPVPRTRLLIWFAAIVIPLAMIATIVHGALIVSLACIGVFVAVVIFDAFGRRAALANVAIDLPPVVRLQKDCDALLQIRIHNGVMTRRAMRIGIPFPREISCDSEEVVSELPAGVEVSILDWRCRPTLRGKWVLRRYFLETQSGFGFWAFRDSRTIECELRVYPNFMEERKHVAALFLNRGRLGLHARRQVGRGREFEKLRDYSPGDSYEDIHWKASAKRGRPVTKEYQVERTQEVYVVFDASRLMGRDPAIFDRYLSAALLLGVAAEQQGDAFGMLAFSDHILHFARAKVGRAQFDTCREMMYGLQPQAVTPDFDELASFIRIRLQKRALLIFLTSLDDPAISESFLRGMDLISRQHLILVNMLQPPAAIPIFAGGAAANQDEIYDRLGGHLLWHDLREIGKTLQRRGIRFSLMERETISAWLLKEYVNVKSMQLI